MIIVLAVEMFYGHEKSSETSTTTTILDKRKSCGLMDGELCANLDSRRWCSSAYNVVREVVVEEGEEEEMQHHSKIIFNYINIIENEMKMKPLCE